MSGISLSRKEREEFLAETHVGVFSVAEDGGRAPLSIPVWYRYEPGSRTRIPDPIVEEVAAEEAARRGITRRSISDEEIIARIMTALANEGARVLDEGYAIRASDIDVVYVHGFGYPRHRGGPMFYADTVGLSTVLERVHQYREQFGDYWTAAPLLEKLAAEGRGFHAES